MQASPSPLSVKSCSSEAQTLLVPLPKIFHTDFWKRARFLQCLFSQCCLFSTAPNAFFRISIFPHFIRNFSGRSVIFLFCTCWKKHSLYPLGAGEKMKPKEPGVGGSPLQDNNLYGMGSPDGLNWDGGWQQNLTASFF